MLAAAILGLQWFPFAYVQMPPARYDHPFAGTIQVQTEDPQKAFQFCHGPALACAIKIGPQACLIIINEKYNFERDKLLTHERAHCNGWPANHPR